MNPGDRFRIRRATSADLPACGAVWRDGLNDYLGRQGRYEVPAENPGLGRLHAHALASDPERFLVAEDDIGRVVAFGSAIRRERLWFLSMLFVLPDLQAGGLGRTILERLLPEDGADAILATATDSGQPMSNGLYASFGMVPRAPLFNLVGRPGRPDALPSLPAGITAGRVDGMPATAVARDIDALDAEVLGFRRAVDHGYVRSEGRSLFVYRDGAGGLAGYGYTSEVGRIGPVGVRDPDLLAPVVGHLLTTVEPRGASAVWVGGDADETFVALVRAGLRIEDLPVLLCWREPFIDLARALPISPGLL